MAALQLGAPLALKTSSIGWPVELNIYKIRDDVYFDVTVTLEYLGLQKHVKKHGFSSIDKFLCDNGIQNCFVLNKNQRNRDFIRYAAFVMLAVRYQGTDWGTCGFPGNSHDAVIFQSTKLYSDIKEGTFIPQISKDVNGVQVPPAALGYSAFPLSSWLMKPYTNAVPTPKQYNCNYRLSRARMVTEGAFGQLKGRWHILLRKCESSTSEVKIAALACLVLHNICIDLGDTLPRKLDLTIDPVTNQRRSRAKVRELLQMRECEKIKDTCYQGLLVRDALAETFWLEKETGIIKSADLNCVLSLFIYHTVILPK